MRLAKQAPFNNSEDEFDYGMALAHLQRWSEAQAALERGHKLCPRDSRFPVELAGVEFQQKHNANAAVWLRRGLKLNPNDKYALNFAGTVYYLMGNLPAALKYWNRVQKPDIADLQFDANLRVRHLVLDRAIVFAPTQVLTRDQLEATQKRVEGMGIFPTYNFTISARADGRFDARFHALERDGFGNRWQAIVSTFGGLPYETIYPSYYNLGRSGTNLESLLRWDAEKRRLWVSMGGPVRLLPQWRWHLWTDERDENWSVRRSFTGNAPMLGALHLRRELLAGTVTGFQSARFTWRFGGEVSNRSYSHVVEGSALNSTLTKGGVQAKFSGAADTTILDVPERRLKATVSGSADLARLWSSPPRLYGKLQASERLHWYPQATSERYELIQQFRAGRIIGSAPFDELWMLGVERDNELWYRGAIGTRDGRKGSAPIGNSYLLANHDFYRRIYDNGLFGVSAGPLLDVGRVGASTAGLAPHSWLVSTGAEARLSVLGTGIVLTYGRDLRAGTNAVFATVTKQF